MASDKDVTNYWVRNDINGDVAGPFSTAQMSDYLKTLPKDKFGFYKVKSSKWNDWKPLVSVIKEKSASGPSDAPSVPLNPPKAPVKSSTPPATPKVECPLPPLGEEEEEDEEAATAGVEEGAN